MIKFFHHLFNPHCAECRDEKLDDEVCDSCNTLRLENAQLRKHNDDLIKSLLDQLKPKPIEITNQQAELPRPVGGGLNWRARRQMLEQEDRATAKILRDKNAEMNLNPVSASVESLELELGVQEDASKIS